MSYTSELRELNSNGKQPSMPDRGTSTGLNGDTYGADISGDATNSMGKIKKATESHMPFENCAKGE